MCSIPVGEGAKRVVGADAGDMHGPGAKMKDKEQGKSPNCAGVLAHRLSKAKAPQSCWVENLCWVAVGRVCPIGDGKAGLWLACLTYGRAGQAAP